MVSDSIKLSTQDAEQRCVPGNDYTLKRHINANYVEIILVMIITQITYLNFFSAIKALHPLVFKIVLN